MPSNDPICPLCQMALSMENLIDAAKRFPPEQLCKHGQTVFPTYTPEGYLAGPDLTQKDRDSGIGDSDVS